MPIARLPENIKESYTARFMNKAPDYQLVSSMYSDFKEDNRKSFQEPEKELRELRSVRFGKDDTYYVNDDKTTAVIIEHIPLSIYTAKKKKHSRPCRFLMLAADYQ